MVWYRVERERCSLVSRVASIVVMRTWSCLWKLSIGSVSTESEMRVYSIVCMNDDLFGLVMLMLLPSLRPISRSASGTWVRPVTRPLES